MTYTDLIAAVAEILPESEYFAVEVIYHRHSSGIQPAMEWRIYAEGSISARGSTAEHALEAFQAARQNPVPDASIVNAHEVQP